MTMIFFVLGLVSWLSIAFALASLASAKNRSSGWAFFLGLFFPVPAVIYYMAVPSAPAK